MPKQGKFCIRTISKDNGKGRIFNPNPVVTLNDTALKDNSQIPESAYSEVNLENLDDSGMLDGSFASTQNSLQQNQKGQPPIHFQQK